MSLLSNKVNKILILVILMCFSVFIATAQTITSNQTGNQGGYWYTFWTNGQGSVSMTLGSGGQFSCQWSNCGNFVAGKGWSTGSSRTITYSKSGSAQYIGVYGWMTNPLVEYYIGQHSGGSSKGSYSADGQTYTLYIDNRNGPNIQGDGPFQQYNAVGNGNPCNFGQHTSGWSSVGASVGSQNYQVVAIEGWNSSGNASVTVGGGSSTTTSYSSSSTTTSYGGSTTTSTSGSGNITVRARGTKGGERLEVRANGSAVASFTMSTSYADYKCNGSGTIQVAFTNDDQQSNGMDIQVDYVVIDGTTYQAENQSTNTGVYQNSQCGGSNSEWLHCNGYIQFGSGTSTPAPGTTTTTWGGSTTTSSGGNTTTSSGSGTQYILRARSTDGQGQVRLIVGSTTGATWTLSSSMSNYTVSTSASGSGCRVEFFNDATNRDVQVDYLSVGGSIRQAESQSNNTAVYQNGGCGGSNSEWMHCNGYIGF